MLRMTGKLFSLLILLAAVGAGQSVSPAKPGNERARDFWNDKFRSGLPNVRREPSRLLEEAVAKARPGAALDLGSGEGRNLLYLAEKGWTATGIDISEVAAEQARAAAAARKLHVNAVVSDLDEFDLGADRWDLLSSIYMQDWHLKSKTNTFARMRTALKPGGLIIIEGFGPPNGLSLDAIKRQFEGFVILRAEIVADDPDWGQGRGNKQILRFIARK